MCVVCSFFSGWAFLCAFWLFGGGRARASVWSNLGFHVVCLVSAFAVLVCMMFQLRVFRVLVFSGFPVLSRFLCCFGFRLCQWLEFHLLNRVALLLKPIIFSEAHCTMHCHMATGR